MAEITIVEAVSELNTRLARLYENGEPYRVSLSGHRPDFLVESLDPLVLLEFEGGGPSLIGRHAVRGLVYTADKEVASVFDGMGWQSSKVYAIRNSPKGINNMFRYTGLPYTISPR